MHKVVLLYRCYPSTPHGVGPWLPAPSSAPQPIQVTMSRPRLDSTPDGPRIVAFTRTALGFGHWLSETAEDEYWLFRPANHEQLVYLHDPTVVYDETGHDQHGYCGPHCDCPF